MSLPAIQPLAAQMRVLAIAGSLRARSYNLGLLRAAMAQATADLEIRLYHGLHGIPHFNEDSEAAEMSVGPVRELIDQVDSADALLIATPEYNHSLPGVLKNAIDWLSRPRDGCLLSGKPVAIIGATSGHWGTRLAQAALRQALYALEARLVTGPALYLANAQAAFDADGNLRDPAARASLQAVLSELSRQMRASR